MVDIDRPCHDANGTKVIFRSQNYPASEDSSSKSRSKLLRYNHTDFRTPSTMNSKEHRAPVSLKLPRKKLPLSEFQLCEPC